MTQQRQNNWLRNVRVAERDRPRFNASVTLGLGLLCSILLISPNAGAAPQPNSAHSLEPSLYRSKPSRSSRHSPSQSQILQTTLADGQGDNELLDHTSGFWSNHQFSVYTRSALALHLSDARTAGGLGGGFGIRDSIGDYFLAQLDATWLSQLGNVLAVRLAAGVQKPGTWRPAALLAVNAMFGDQLLFPDAGRPAIDRPPLSVDLILAPLRFSSGKAEVSLFELGVGVGPETPGAALSLSLGFEVGAQLF